MPRSTGWWRRGWREVTLTVPVAIDGRRLQDHPYGGVGRWLANLLPHLAEAADVVLVTDAGRPPAVFGLPSGHTVPEAPLWLPRRAPEAVWVQSSLPRWLRRFGGVFHGTFNQLPATWRGPAVVTFHDLATLEHPEDFAGQPIKRRVWNVQFHQAARQAAVIQTDSEFMRRAILGTFPVQADQVVVAAPAVDPIFHPDRRDAGRRRAAALGVKNGYVVAVGGARRRGLPVAVAGWAEARRKGMPEELVVVGAEAVAGQPGLFHAGPLPDEAWADLLAGAKALLYPTRYEGFGLPALEAAASGVPVVCPPTGPLPEVLGDAPEWCTDAGPAALASALRRLLSDRARQAARAAAGVARAAAAPTWGDAAQVLLAAYERAAR